MTRITQSAKDGNPSLCLRGTGESITETIQSYKRMRKSKGIPGQAPVTYDELQSKASTEKVHVADRKCQSNFSEIDHLLTFMACGHLAWN